MSMLATYEREYTKSGGGNTQTAERPRPASSGQQNEACGSHPSVPQLAIAAIPLQQWEEPYQPSQALQCGTIFPSLNKPFYKTGGEFRG